MIVVNECQTSTWGSLTQVFTESYSSVTLTLLSEVWVKLEWSLETVYGSNCPRYPQIEFGLIFTNMRKRRVNLKTWADVEWWERSLEPHSNLKKLIPKAHILFLHSTLTYWVKPGVILFNPLKWSKAPPHTHTILLSIKLSILKIVNFIDS